MRFSFGLQIGQIDVAFLVTGHGDDFQACHHRAGGICSVRGSWYQANIPVRIVTTRVISSNDQQSRVLALRARIGL